MGPSASRDETFATPGSDPLPNPVIYESRRHRYAAPLARRQRRVQPCRGPPGARRATPTERTDQCRLSRRPDSCTRSRLPRHPLSSSRPPRLRRFLRSRRMRSATPTLDPAATHMDSAPTRKLVRTSLDDREQDRTCDSIQPASAGPFAGRRVTFVHASPRLGAGVRAARGTPRALGSRRSRPAGAGRARPR